MANNIRVLIQKPVDGSGSGVQSVNGDGVNNADPLNPVLSFPTPEDIGALKQGSNTLTQDLELKRTGTNKESEVIIDDRDIGIRSTDIVTGAFSEVFIEDGAAFLDSSDPLGDNVGVEANAVLKYLLLNNKFGNGARFDSSSENSNVDWDVNKLNVPNIEMIEENLPSKLEVLNYTSGFTIPNDTDDKYFTLKNATDQTVIIEATSFSRVGAFCSVSTNGSVGFAQIVGGSNVVLLDDNSISTDTVLQKGLMCVDITGLVVTVEII